MTMMADSQKKAAVFTAIFFVVGIVGHLVDFSRPYFLLLTPITLLAGAILCLYFVFSFRPSLLWWVIVSYVITLIIEIIGVKTGHVFGEYWYGKVLGPMLFEVPLIIGLNWVIIILGIWLFLYQYQQMHFIVRVFLTALGCTLFDYIMEPVAIFMGYWWWKKTLIPLQNYAAWFSIAFVLSLMFFFFLRKEKSKSEKITVFAGYYVFIQFIFFLVLRVWLFL